MTEYSKLAAMISSEFNRYIMEHEEVATAIPQNALVVFQIEGEKGFNEWSRNLSLKNIEQNQPTVVVQIKKWRQKSYVEDLDMTAVNE